MNHFDYTQCRQKGFAPVLVLIGITVILAVAASTYYLNNLLAPMLKLQSSLVSYPSPKPINIPQPTSIPDETTNWKTYTNEKYRYLIRYPAIWKLQTDDQNGISLSSPDLGYSEESGYPNRGAMINIDVQVTDLKTLEEVYKQVLRNKFLKVTERKDIIVDGKSALRLEVNSIDAPSGPNVYILQNGKQYSFQFWQIGNNYEKTFDQILSTFKFLDQNKRVVSDGITLEAARAIIPIHPSVVTAEKNGGLIKVKWSGTGGGGDYQVYRKLTSDDEWTKLVEVKSVDDNRGGYEFKDTNAQENVSYVYGVSIINGLGTESEITESAPIP